MPRIRALKPNMTREEATENFSSSGMGGPLTNVWRGRLRSVAEFYIPFRLFKVGMQEDDGPKEHILAMDLVEGKLDPYPLDELPSPYDIVSVDTRNCAPVVLTDEQAVELMRKQVRRLVRSQGFFRQKQLQIAVEEIPGDIYIPYWVGIRGHGALPHLTVINAVTEHLEGAGVRKLLQSWLRTAA